MLSAAISKNRSTVDGERFSFDAVIQYSIYAAVAILVITPIVPIMVQSFRTTPLYASSGTWTFSEYIDLARDGRFWTALRNTTIFGLGSTLIAQVIGVTVALLVGRTDLPFKGLINSVMIWPLYVSHLVLAFGWVIAYGPSGYVTLSVASIIGAEPWQLYTLTGLCVAAGTSMAPLTYLYCISVAQTVDGTLENAARISGASAFRSLVTITLPLLRPAIIISAILNFVLAVELLVIPLLLGSPSGIEFLTTFVYANGFLAPIPRHGLVAAVAVLLLLLVTGLVLLQMWFLRDAQRFVTVTGKAARLRIIPLGYLRWPIAVLAMFYLVFFIGVVLGGLVLRAFVDLLSPFVPIHQVLTLANFALIFEYPQYVRSIWNTIWVALFGGVIGTVIVVAAAFVALRSEAAGRNGLAFLAVYPRAIPGIFVGMGMLWAMSWVPGLSLLQNTIWIVVLAFIIRHLPTAWGTIQPSLLQISRDHDRAARVVGAGWMRTCLTVLTPQLRGALLASFLLLFIHFVKEYAVAVFLFSPGSEVLGSTMLTFWIQGENGAVAALSVLQIGIVAVFALILGFIRRRTYHV